MRRVKSRGVALIVVMAFIVLLTGLLLAFFSRSSTGLQIATSSANQTLVDVFARGALDSVVGDLKQEIAAGSIISGSGEQTVFYPRRHTVVPSLNALNPGGSHPANLLKRSAYNSPFFAGAAYDPAWSASNRACGPSAESATTVASRNGRSISLHRWNRALLLPKAQPSSALDWTPVSAGPEGFQAPEWVLVSRDGSNPAQWNSSLKDSSSSALVLGRYAYAVYDEGGLLDLNVAGYPAALPAAQSSYKSSLAFADLRQLPGFSELKPARLDEMLNTIVGWRHYATAQPGGAMPDFTFSSAQANSYWQAALAAPNARLSTANPGLLNSQSDRMFAGRQALIRFLTYAVAERSTERARLQNALQCLGTFSRDLEQPSFAPDPGRPALVGDGLHGGNNAFDRLDARADGINPAFLSIRAGSAFVRADGSTARAGEPLVKSRFALSRLGSIRYDTVAGSGSTIHRRFGLQRASAGQPWTYFHGAPGAILRLSEVAALSGANAREADFVELLKAAISAGSLGRGADQGALPALTAQNLRDTSLDRQVLQIAANILDQADADSYPTQITFDAASPESTISGVENLPGLYRSRVLAVRTGLQDGTLLITPEIWNPHDVSCALGSPRPARFRVTAEGQLRWVLETGAAEGPLVTLTRDNSALVFEDPAAAIREPILLRSPEKPAGYQLGAAPDNLLGMVETLYREPAFYSPPGALPNRYLGFFAGQFAGLWPVSSGVQLNIGVAAAGSSQTVVFRLEYWSGSAWVAYNQWATRANLWATLADDAADVPGLIPGFRMNFASDPRTDRFGIVGGNAGITPFGNAFSASSSGPGPLQSARIDALNSLNNVFSTNRPDATDQDNAPGFPGYGATVDLPSGAGWVRDAVFRPGLLSQNIFGQRPRQFYQDADGVVRRAMGALATLSTNDLNASVIGLPLASYNHRSRPVMLNRPFRSVAELGCVFRGTPWKNLDFFTPESGDCALLDVFCVNEPAVASPLVAGKLNLNTRQVPVLTAVLAGAPLSLSSGSALTGNQAALIANALVLRTTSGLPGQGPLRNPSELVGKFVAGFANPYGQPFDGFSSDLGGLLSANLLAPENVLQQCRECAIRALADVGTTRVWNLMIDLVAQTGRFPPAARGVADFVVAGEQRYWLHVAIDRFSGQVLDSVLEPVKE